MHFSRQCQECGNIQKAKRPDGEPTSAFQEAKCRRCKSEGSLDYGRERSEAEIAARPTASEWRHG